MQPTADPAGRAAVPAAPGDRRRPAAVVAVAWPPLVTVAGHRRRAGRRLAERMDLRVSEVVSDWALRDSGATGRSGLPRPAAVGSCVIVLAGLVGYLAVRRRALLPLARVAVALALLASSSTASRAAGPHGARFPGRPSSTRRRSLPVRARRQRGPHVGRSPAGRRSSRAARAGAAHVLVAQRAGGPLVTGLAMVALDFHWITDAVVGRASACCSWAWFMHWTPSLCHAGSCQSRPADRVAARRRACGVGGTPRAAARPRLSCCPRAPRRPAPARPHRCQITDPRLAELSGLVGVGDQMLAINDGGDRAEGLRARRRLPGRRRHIGRRRPVRPGGHGAGRRRHHLAGRHRGQRADRTTVALIGLRPDGSEHALPADLPRRCARRRGAAAGAGRDAVHRHQGDAGRQRVYRPAARWSTARRSPMAGRSASASRSPAPPAARRAGRAAAGDRRSGLARTAADRAADLHRRLRLAARRLRRRRRAGRRAGADPAAGLAAGRGHHVRREQPDRSSASEGLPGAVTVVPLPAATWPPAAARGRCGAATAGRSARSMRRSPPASSPPWWPTAWCGSAASSGAVGRNPPWTAHPRRR